MELFLAILNGLLLIGVTVGVYKNKVDSTVGYEDKILDIDHRLIRLEEKVNYIYNILKGNK